MDYRLECRQKQLNLNRKPIATKWNYGETAKNLQRPKLAPVSDDSTWLEIEFIIQEKMFKLNDNFC